LFLSTLAAALQPFSLLVFAVFSAPPKTVRDGPADADNDGNRSKSIC
jgi:hypothetical protein